MRTGAYPLLDTKNIENIWQMKKEADCRRMRRMAKVHNFLEMWQGSQNLDANQKESRAHYNQMTALESILDTEEIVKTPSSLFPNDGASPFSMSKQFRSPPRLCA